MSSTDPAAGKGPRMSFVDAVRTCFEKYVVFSGRAARAEYWWFVLFALLAQLVTGTLDGLIFGFEEESTRILSALASLAMLLPGIAVSVRRLHDIGRSGWWILIGLVPLIGFLVLLYLYVQPSEDGPNAFGPPPAGPGDAAA